MNEISAIQHELLLAGTRRHFLKHCVSGLGALWLAQSRATASAGSSPRDERASALPLPAKAKHVIFLHMTGAPSQLDLFDYKPELIKLGGKDCPRSYLDGKRFAFIRGTPKLLGPVYPFHQSRATGHWVSDQLPHFEKVLDKVCFIHSMQTDQFNHAPAQLLAHTGNQNLGYASLGAWALYGLGSQSDNLPGFVVLLSGGQNPDAGKAVWGSGFLPGVYQGVQCRSKGDPVLYLSNPPGVSRDLRRGVVDAINILNQRSYAELGDAETLTRIGQYEMAFRMQISATEALDLSREPTSIQELYGIEPGKESFANNCLLARRLVERGVRYVQLFDWGWDHHSHLGRDFPKKCRQIDRPMAALLMDLEQRGLLDETLVIWSGEFGRTPMQENRGGVKASSLGRDHHADAFTLWMAGGGVRPGLTHGATDEIGFNVATDVVRWRDFHATVLRLLGLDHNELHYPYQGLDQKITGVKPAKVVSEVIG